jgi:SNF family Na+-dependent transporter
LLIAILVGWRMGRGEALAEADLSRNAVGHAWLWLMRIVVPAMIILILARSLGII